MRKRYRTRTWFSAALTMLMTSFTPPVAAEQGAASGSRCSGGYVAMAFDAGPTDLPAVYLKALRDAGRVIRTQTGCGPTLFRPPSGSTGARTGEVRPGGGRPR